MFWAAINDASVDQTIQNNDFLLKYIDFFFFGKKAYLLHVIRFAVMNVKLLQLMSKASKLSNSNLVGYLFYYTEKLADNFNFSP